jgi:hypothetical protein
MPWRSLSRPRSDRLEVRAASADSRGGQTRTTAAWRMVRLALPASCSPPQPSALGKERRPKYWRSNAFSPCFWPNWLSRLMIGSNKQRSTRKLADGYLSMLGVEGVRRLVVTPDCGRGRRRPRRTSLPDWRPPLVSLRGLVLANAAMRDRRRWRLQTVAPRKAA